MTYLGYDKVYMNVQQSYIVSDRKQKLTLAELNNYTELSPNIK